MLAEATLTVVLFSERRASTCGRCGASSAYPRGCSGSGSRSRSSPASSPRSRSSDELAWPEALVLAIILAPTEPRSARPSSRLTRFPSGSARASTSRAASTTASASRSSSSRSRSRRPRRARSETAHAAQLVVEKIGYGIVGGVVAGAAAAAIVVVRRRPALVDDTWLQVVPLAGAALAFGLAEAIGGSGFIAAFVGGAVFGGLRRHAAARSRTCSSRPAPCSQPLTFVVFGAVLLGPALGDLTWQIALYAVLSLTLVRMLPVAIAMLGSGARGADGRHSSAGSGRAAPRRSSSRSSSSRRAASRTRSSSSRPRS